MSFGDSVLDIELNPRKTIVHADKLAALAAGRDVFPVTVELDLVDCCNHACWWCVDPRHGQHQLEPAFVSSLLRELKTLGIEGIVYKGGGEPTLHPSFADVLAETHALGFEAGIVTNGSKLHRYSEVIARHANYLRVSIDAPTAASHAELHQSRDFDHIVDGVSRTIAQRNRCGQRHPVIGLSFAMDFQMLGLVDEAVRLGDRLNVDYILFRPPFMEEVGRTSRMTAEQKSEVLAAFDCAKATYQGRMTVLIDYWISDSDAAVMKARGESPRRGRYTRPGMNGIEHVTGRCVASPLLAVVAADHQVYPCCNLRLLDEWGIGQINYERGDTFEKLWRGPGRRAVLDRLHHTECIRHCTHPLSKYNEDIEYLRSPQYHRGFV